MRVTFVLPPVNMSGGIKVVGIYAKALADKGHEIFVVSPPPSEKSLRSKIKLLLTGKGWPETEVAHSHLDNSSLNHKVLNKYRPVTDSDVPEADVIVATWWETAEWVAKLSNTKGAKTYFIQGYEIFDFLPVERCKLTYKLPFHKIVVAKWLADIMKVEYGDNHVDLVHNSVDHKQFFAPVRDKQNVPTVGFLYSCTRLKGLDITLKVLERIKRGFPNLRVVSFGSSPWQEDNLWDNQYEFHYSPKQNEIRNIYGQCDVWMSASRTEGFNLPAMEAMACRTPVVATKTGWPVESIRNGENGFLVEIDDIDALEHAVTTVLTEKNEDWRRYSSNAFKTVENSSWEKSAALFEKALMNSIKRNTDFRLKSSF
jgi:glycosyltransferase involved in cell wall biosynthesis